MITGKPITAIPVHMSYATVTCLVIFVKILQQLYLSLKVREIMFIGWSIIHLKLAISP